MKANSEILFNVEELHRGKWQPLKLDSGKQKTVRITEDEAEVMNSQSKYHNIRYVKVDDKKTTKK